MRNVNRKKRTIRKVINMTALLDGEERVTFITELLYNVARTCNMYKGDGVDEIKTAILEVEEVLEIERRDERAA